jgi:hypothetical protein
MILVVERLTRKGRLRAPVPSPDVPTYALLFGAAPTG